MAARKRRRTPWWLVLAWTVLAAVPGAPLLAQSGSLEVILLDGEQRQPLPGATVTVRSTLGLTAETSRLTDEEGLAEFPVLRTGRGYEIEAAFPGYAAQRFGGVQIRTGQTERLVLLLSAALEERIRVSARQEVIELDQAGHATRFGDDFIANLPVLDRLYQNVLTLAPGVKDSDGDGNPNVHGARNRDFKAMVGGVSNVDPLTGQWLSYVNFDTIEEMQVITSGAGVEFGRAQGGFARVLQKQGSNEFEGVFNIILRSSELDGNGAASDLAGPAPEFETIQPAIQLSGPIVEDRLWYRLSHEYISREDPVNVLGAIEVVTRKQNQAADQLTWQVSPRNKLAFQFQYDPLTVENLDLSSSVRPESSRDLERGGPTYTVTWTAAQSARLLVETLIAYQDQSVDIVPSTRGVQNDCMLFTRYELIETTRCLNIGTNQVSGSFFETTLDQRQRFTVRSDATLYAGRFLGARHRLKFGFIAENERYFRDLERRAVIDSFERVRLLFDDAQFRGDAEARLFAPRFSSASARGTSWAVYFEDRIKPLDGLVVTVGLRFDREEINSSGRTQFDPQEEYERFLERLAEGGTPPFLLQIQAFTGWEGIPLFERLAAEALEVSPSIVVAPFLSYLGNWINLRQLEAININNDNLAPRVSIAWDPWQDGKTKFAVSAGRYYDKIFLAVPLVELEPASSNFIMQGYPLPNTTSPLIFDEVIDNLQPPTAHTVDRNLRTPFQDEWTVSAERALWGESSLKVSRISREFKDQLQDIEINHDENGMAYNPGWLELLLLGNFNTAEYDAWLVEFVRRYYRGWEMQASYTWSEAIGDAEDFDQLLGNSASFREIARAYLDYDQRHVFRLNAITLTPWGWRVGLSARYESGLPFSDLIEREVQYFNPPEADIINPGSLTVFVPFPERNANRNEDFWTFDVRLQREIEMRGGALARISLEVFNALNDDTLIQGDRIEGALSGTRRFGRQFQVGARVQF